MQTASDFLTDQVRSFVVSGKREYLNEYFKEVNVTRRRETALAELRSALGGTEAYAKLESVMKKSSQLQDRELYAMRLMISALGYDVSQFPVDIQNIELEARDAALSRDLSERRMEKHYYAVVAGVMKEPSGVIDAPIGRSHTDRKKMAVVPDGRPSRTEWRVVRAWPDRTLLDVHLITGRTHQIRVHMSSIHHPVPGDPIYGHKNMPKAPRLMLHAFSLSFTHPATGERLTFTAPPEACFGVEEAAL